MEQKKSPLPAPLRVLKELIRRYFSDHVGRSAAEFSYYFLFSIFPLLIFLNVIISMLHLSADMLTNSLGGVLPPQAAEVLSSYLSYIQGLDTPVLLYACLFLTVYAISRAITSLLRSTAHAYRIIHQGRFNLVAGILFSVLLLVSILLLLVLMMVSENLLRELGQYITIPDPLIRIWGLLRMIVAPVYLFLVMACFYAMVGFGRYRFWQALPGAGFTVVGWFLATTGFSYYLGHASRYSVLYGSLTAFMVLMLWFYLTGTIIILGGELNHILASLSVQSRVKPEKEKEPTNPWDFGGSL